jgi:ketosteroid isomerase-like protein
MTPDQIDQLIERHYRAEERGDPDGAVADLADDVEHEVAGQHQTDSREGARAFYAQLFEGLSLQRIRSQRRLYGDSFAVDEATVEAVTRNGEPSPFRLLHVFEFENGQITRESAWQAAIGDSA